VENVVVDTNVVLSYALKPNGEAGKAFLNAMENFNILQSNETFEEFVEVINREKFSKYIPDEFREELIDRFAARSELVEINHTVERDLCRDPKDNKFLELAVSGNAKYIISGDKDLLDIKQYKEIEILSPSQFLEQTQKIEQPHTATLSESATASAQQVTRSHLLLRKHRSGEKR